MFSNKAIRTAGVVGRRQSQFLRKLALSGIATLSACSIGLMSSSADVINLGETGAVAVYAKETLSDARSQEGDVDKKTYYDVMSTVPWSVTGEIGVGIPANQLIVARYNFANAVFAQELTSSSLKQIGSSTPALISGGKVGENFAVFALTPTGAVESDVALTLSLGDDNIIAVSPDAPVSVSREITLRGFTDVVPPKVARYTSAIVVADALSVKVDGNSPTATVSTGFLSFADEPSASLGTITAVLNTTDAEGPLEPPVAYLKSLDGYPTTFMELFMAGNVDGGGTQLSFEGDFSFLKGAYLEEITSMCSPEPSSGNLVSRDEDTMELEDIPDTAIPNDDPDTDQDDPPFSYRRKLCIYLYDAESEEAVQVPRTESYMASFDFVAIDRDQVFSPADRTVALGRIKRDGTTVHIPYLTTYEGYNHRITLSNRSGTAADYSFSFRPEGTVTAVPGMYATGTLAARETKVLRAMDVVTLEGGSRTAATVDVVANKTSIDVSSTLVNLSNGTAAVTVHLSDTGLNIN